MSALSHRAEVELTDGDFRIIQSALRSSTGIALPEGKRPLVISRLTRRLRSLKMRDFSEYSALISRPEGSDELGHMISALTTNVTAFFREGHHFETLQETVLPPLIARACKGGKLRLWSSACSSGEEAYSMAITLLELCPEADQLDIRILATDIDPAILETAKAGRYPADALTTVPPKQREKWFHPDTGNRGPGFRVRPELARCVTFRRLNLTGPWPMKAPFDAIFCRNVAIYFDRDVQERLWQRLVGQLSPEGVLFIGHSERIAGPATALVRQQGITTYIRRRDEGVR